MSSITQAFNEKRDAFIKERTTQELAIKQWGEQIKNIDPEILKDVELPAEISLKAFVPELYEDNPKQAVYDQQYDKMMELFNKINAIAEKYYQEALECSTKYQTMSTQPTS